MLKTADAVVIGGGILGASAAHFLAKKGFGKVALLEKRALSAVSTGHSAAVIRTFYSNAMTIRLALRALEMFENDREALGGDCRFRRTGYLCLLAEHTAASGRQVLQAERSQGVEVRDLSAQEVQELIPPIDLKGLVGGVYEPNSGYADPVRTTRHLVEKAKEWGLEAYEGVGATGIRLKEGRVAGVDTEQGTIDTRVVVNAAGPWGRQMGLSAGLNYSLRWSRESDIVIKRPSGLGPFPVTSDPNLRVYLRPEGEDEVLAGLGFPKEVEPLDIERYDPNIDAVTRKRIEDGIFERIPILRGAAYVRGWASVYTITDDWHPLVGPEPGLEGYYACFGGSGHSFKLGPPIGESLSDIIVGKTPKIDLHAFRPSRFLEGEIFTSAWGGGNRA